MVQAEIGQNHFRISADHHQQVVEVVRHSSGEAADGFHFLGLAKLILQHAAVGDVFGDGFEDVGRLVHVAHSPSADAHGDGSAILALPLQFNAIEASGAAEFCDQPRMFFGVREYIFLRIE
jgi:hypothetical protein